MLSDYNLLSAIESGLVECLGTIVIKRLAFLEGKIALSILSMSSSHRGIPAIVHLYNSIINF